MRTLPLIRLNIYPSFDERLAGYANQASQHYNLSMIRCVLHTVQGRTRNMHLWSSAGSKTVSLVRQSDSCFL